MKRVWRRLFTVIFCLAVLAAGMVSTSYFRETEQPEASIESSTGPIVPVTVEEVQVQSREEMRGVWIPCMTLQANEDERNEDGYREKIRTIMSTCEQNGLNTVIVQVRPFSDALYPSRYFPWSHILTGEQGVGVDFDPLAILLEQAHAHGLALHAWINPLRIRLGSVPEKLSEKNPAVVWKNDNNRDNDGYTFTDGDGEYYDPSWPEVRKLIIDGVRELAGQYDIDGLQIDDYFYPSDDGSFDKKSYERYVSSLNEGSTPLSQADWRKNNINMLVSGIRSALHRANSRAVFGISPQGNFENNEKLSADTASWCSVKGYADYLCPQLYVSMSHPVFPFRALADRWIAFTKDSSLPLYFGLGLYKAGTDADSGTWLSSSSNIREQIAYLRSKGVDGFILYAYDFLTDDHAHAEVENAMAELKPS